MIFKKSIKTNVFSMFLLLDIENMQNPSGFIRFFEILNFFIFRKVYKNQWILTLFENLISAESNNINKNQWIIALFENVIVTTTIFQPFPLLLLLNKRTVFWKPRITTQRYFGLCAKHKEMSQIHSLTPAEMIWWPFFRSQELWYERKGF